MQVTISFHKYQFCFRISFGFQLKYNANIQPLYINSI